MADFDVPFATDAEKRFPSAAEHQQGFPCGPADQKLFNGLFYRLEAEIGSVVNFAGIGQTDARMTNLLEAIQQLIASAIGALPTGPDTAPDTSGFLMLSQAVARLPIFPDVQTTDGRFGVTSTGVGNVHLPAGVSFLQRGIRPVVSAAQDFATIASKTYHLRWRGSTGLYSLLDLADTGYNPALVAETDTRFDSTFDDMLIARVITNASNVPVITDLANKDRLLLEMLNAGALNNPATNDALRTTVLNWNLARRPQCAIEVTNIQTSPNAGQNNTFPASATHDHDYQVTRANQNRYGVSLTLSRDWGLNMDILANVRL